jgi:hypothetical protein
MSLMIVRVEMCPLMIVRVMIVRGENVSDELPCEEELQYDEKNYAPNVEYDPLDPPMVVGSSYASMPEFRLAICQYAIKHEFEFNTVKSAPNRFRAYCARRDLDNCPWWIFASTTQDESTVQVIVYSCFIFVEISTICKVDYVTNNLAESFQ